MPRFEETLREKLTFPERNDMTQHFADQDALEETVADDLASTNPETLVELAERFEQLTFDVE
ncbi:hypothetical protein DV711_06190 [Motiliproteus coralliicola]|uniref:Uncharacterized protein n=1 Tax=Motiliproteus coralliicola TaxID=2283196 RepID=A0A369WTY8_9GAMM|nr:hypothetical protein [Motiliproteus coralliicola]RDE25142.1 hypothetical protein DV711_06190 [Motiliproteus coralliicola]